MKPTYNIVVANHVNTAVMKWKIGMIYEWGNHAGLTVRPMMTTRLTLELELRSR